MSINPASQNSPTDILVVDLDGTLIRSDTFIEMIVWGLCRYPLATLMALLSLLKGRAIAKRKLSKSIPFQPDNLPFNPELLTFIKHKKESGTELHLVSAADQYIVDKISGRFGIFKTAVGSDGKKNLKGSAKASYLKKRFQKGFSYAGNSSSDIPVWDEAKSVVLVNTNSRLTSKIKKKYQVDAILDQRTPDLVDWIKTFRIHQWTKNLLIFLALFLGHEYLNLESWAQVGGTFIVFSIVASATYVFNDLIDLPADRNHETKSSRPLASGQVSIIAAASLSVGMMILGMTTMFMVGQQVFLLLLTYVVTTVLYSFTIKKVTILDLVVLAGLYTLRIVFGVVAADVVLSEWLMVFSMFFFLSLSTAKRYVEIVRIPAGISDSITGRGYRGGDASLLLNFGIGSGMIALFTFCVYLLDSAFPSDSYGSPLFLWITLIAISLWTMRIWLKASRMELDDDPVAFSIKDRTSILLGCMSACGFALAVIL